MSKKTKIAIIAEGVKSETHVLKNLNELFFKNCDIVPIIFPTCTNIYALYKMIQEDEDLDIIELAQDLSKKQNIKRVNQFNEFDFMQMKKSDFAEIYLFYDFDGHNNNLPKGVNPIETMKKMLALFDNETEHGKMYISYPMIEAVRHFHSYDICKKYNECMYDYLNGRTYKEYIDEIALYHDLKRFSKETWSFQIDKFLHSISCLFYLDIEFNKEFYTQNITPLSIYNQQLKNNIATSHKVMVLSAFPEFLLDYFRFDKLCELLGEKIEFPNVRPHCDVKIEADRLYSVN